MLQGKGASGGKCLHPLLLLLLFLPAALGLNITVFPKPGSPNGPKRTTTAAAGGVIEFCVSYNKTVSAAQMGRIIEGIAAATTNLCYPTTAANTANSFILSIECATADASKAASLLSAFVARVSPAGNAGVLERQAHDDFSIGGTLEVLTQNSAPWHLDRIEGGAKDSTFNYPTEPGKGITIFVIDTGVRTTHKEFLPAGRASFLVDTISPDVPFSGDCHGHGTHVASLAGGLTFGAAKNSTIRTIRALNCNGYGTLFSVLTAVIAVQEQCDNAPDQPFVLVMSLSGSPLLSVEAALTQLRQTCHALIVVAGGNEADNACDYSPARVPDLLAVGASTSDDNRAAYTNVGPCIGIFAPGHLITGAGHFSDTATAVMSGTSMATPIAGGIGALHLSTYLPEPRGNENLGQRARNVLRDSAQIVAALGDAFTTKKLLRLNASAVVPAPSGSTPTPAPADQPPPSPSPTPPPPPPTTPTPAPTKAPTPTPTPTPDKIVKQPSPFVVIATGRKNEPPFTGNSLFLVVTVVLSMLIIPNM